VTQLEDETLAHLKGLVREPDLEGTKYRFVSFAGWGGMGTVCVVEDIALARRIALKVLDVPDEELELRLTREAQVLARLEHPGIVPVHDVGTLRDGRAFYTMKLVQGEGLDRALSAHHPLPDRLRIFLRIAEAVAFAHARGVLHRDLKPQNVMVGPFGEVLVMDWGLAKVLSEDAPQGEAPPAGRPRRAGDTGDGAVLGTAGFMSPEQQAGRSAAVDERTDVFSLGAMLRYLAAGETPRPLRAVIAKAMAARADDRYQEVAALAEDVSRFLDGAPVSAYPERMLRRLARVAVRHRVAVAIVLAYVVGRALIAFFTNR
jgi:eukaryotic-like serine/threonine-protein kinase